MRKQTIDLQTWQRAAGCQGSRSLEEKQIYSSKTHIKHGMTPHSADAEPLRS
jgi:hypothetical protein